MWEDSPLHTDLLFAREDAARCIFESSSCLVELRDGFKLAIHQELPEAPRLPFYLNLRLDGVKGGKLSASDIATISQAASSIFKRLVIETIQNTGGCKVTDLLVFLNHSTDAEQKLKKLEVRLHAV